MKCSISLFRFNIESSIIHIKHSYVNLDDVENIVSFGLYFNIAFIG